MTLPSFLPDFSGRELRDALRVALQSAISAAVLFILMEAIGMPEKFVGVLSAALVINPGIGSTLSSAWKRVAATAIGAGIGCLCLWVLPGGYGTAVALGISLFVMTGIAGLFPQWQYGVVAAVALALGSDSDLVQTSIDRTLAIGLGVLVGSASSFVIWPQKSSTRADAFIRDALKATKEFLKASVSETDDDLSDESPDELDSLNNRYSRMISSARSEAGNVNFADNGNLMDIIKSTEWLHSALVTIRQIAMNKDNIDGDDKKATKMLADIKENIAQVLDDITDKKSQADQDGIDGIGSQVEEFRSLVSKDETRDNWNHVNRATLVFALGPDLRKPEDTQRALFRRGQILIVFLSPQIRSAAFRRHGADAHRSPPPLQKQVNPVH